MSNAFSDNPVHSSSQLLSTYRTVPKQQIWYNDKWIKFIESITLFGDFILHPWFCDCHEMQRRYVCIYLYFQPNEYSNVVTLVIRSHHILNIVTCNPLNMKFQLSLRKIKNIKSNIDFMYFHGITSSDIDMIILRFTNQWSTRGYKIQGVVLKY